MKCSKKLDSRVRGVLFLLSLTFYVILIIFVFNFGQEKPEKSHADVFPKNSTISFCASENILEWEEFSSVEGESSEEYGEVKATSSKIGRCEPIVYEIPMQFFCGGGGAKGLDAWEIHAPAIMFLGAEAPFDSLVQVNNPDGLVAFRNAAELIMDEEDYYTNMPPARHLLDSSPLQDELKDDPFEMHFSAGGEYWQEIPFDARPDLPRHQSICGDVVNPGYFNVGGTNTLEEEMTHSVSPPGLMKLPDRNFPGLMCNSPDTRYIDLSANETVLLCPKSVYCPPECLEIGCDYKTAMFVDAPLGSTEICRKGDCGIRYWEAGKILTAPPTWANDMYPDVKPQYIENDYLVGKPAPDDAEMLPVVITTPCAARKGCTIYEGLCHWDISIWQHVYDLEQMFTYPEYETKKWETPYWEEVEQELKDRG